MSTALILVGIAILALGIWLIVVGRDPLGYFPPFIYNILGVGSLILMAGIAWRMLQ